MMHFLHNAARQTPQPPAADLWAWFDFSQASAVVTESGGRIISAADLSGNGRDITSSGTARPFYNTRFMNMRNVAEFQGGQHLLFPAGATLGTGNLTVACAYVNDITLQGFILAGRSTLNAHTFRVMSHPAGANSALGVIHHANAVQAVVESAKLHTPSYGGLVRNGASVYGFCNGAVSGDVAATDFAQTGHLAVGGWTDGSVWNFMLDGAIGELLVYTRAFSGGELETLTGYLKAKWGL